VDLGLKPEIKRAGTLSAIVIALVFCAFFALWLLFWAILEPLQRKLAILRALGASDFAMARGCFPPRIFSLVRLGAAGIWLFGTIILCFALLRQCTSLISDTNVVLSVGGACFCALVLLGLCLVSNIRGVRETLLSKLIGLEN
jgi:hypothetical protein